MAVGAGIYPDVREAARNMVHVERRVGPDPSRHEKYKFYVDKYVKTYPQQTSPTTLQRIGGARVDRNSFGNSTPIFRG